MTAQAPRHPVRDRLADLAGIAFAGLVALTAASDAEATGRLTDAAVFWALLVAAGGCIALWWRRPYPVGVAVLLAPLVAVTDFVGGSVLVAVYTVAVTRRWRVTFWIVVLHALASVPYAIIRPSPDLGTAGDLVLSAALLGITVLIAAAVRARRESVAALRGRAARAEAEAAAHDQRLREQERERIAREMHDVLAHRISLVSLHAGALEIRPDLSPEEVARVAGTIRTSAHQALEDLREILGVLRAGGDGNGHLQPQPDLSGLDALLAECRSAGTPVAVEDGLPGTAPVPPLVGRTTYRIVQEGLTNARKHAPGAPVRLLLDRTPAGELHVWLSNPLSTGEKPAVPGARAGLVGLAERVSLAGGRLDHGARRGAPGEVAFHLEAWLPWPA